MPCVESLLHCYVILEFNSKEWFESFFFLKGCLVRKNKYTFCGKKRRKKSVKITYGTEQNILIWYVVYILTNFIKNKKGERKKSFSVWLLRIWDHRVTARFTDFNMFYANCGYIVRGLLCKLCCQKKWCDVIYVYMDRICTYMLNGCFHLIEMSTHTNFSNRFVWRK